jgi:hypothetical protein
MPEFVPVALAALAEPGLASAGGSDRIEVNWQQEELPFSTGGPRPDPGAGFKALAGEQKERKQGAVQFTFCWAHVRRKFFDFHHATGSPIAAEADRRALPDRGAHPRPPAR